MMQFKFLQAMIAMGFQQKNCKWRGVPELISCSESLWRSYWPICAVQTGCPTVSGLNPGRLPDEKPGAWNNGNFLRSRDSLDFLRIRISSNGLWNWIISRRIHGRNETVLLPVISIRTLSADRKEVILGKGILFITEDHCYEEEESCCYDLKSFHLERKITILPVNLLRSNC